MSGNHSLEMNKSFWMPREAGCVIDEEMSYSTSSRTEQKRSHQWFMEASEPELFCKKKQARDDVNTMHMSRTGNNSPWVDTSNFQSGTRLFPEQLFVPGRVGAYTCNLNIERNYLEEQAGRDTSVRLAMSHSLENPSSKANQVSDSKSGLSIAIGHPFSKGDEQANSLNAISCISLGSACHDLRPTCNDGSDATNKANESFFSMGNAFNKEDGTFMLMGHNYNKGNESILSMGQSFDKEDGNFILMDHQYDKGDDNIISLGHAYNKGHENLVPMGVSYNKANENFNSAGTIFGNGSDNIVPVALTQNRVNYSVFPLETTYNSGDSTVASTGHEYKVEGTTISFEDLHDGPEVNNPSGKIISSYDLLTRQHSVQNVEVTSEVPGLRDAAGPNCDPNVNVVKAATWKINATAKTKTQKTPEGSSPTSFPSNVKSLLSTGILDGVPVKYVSWSREKDLRGVIKGTTYLCSCEDCNLTKALNAYEFERHAGCKTKHPNNHIYFENGKSIYAVVQGLKSTAQDKLFEAIQSVTGSPINQKNFRTWKVSYETATRELRRIYGKDEVITPS